MGSEERLVAVILVMFCLWMGTEECGYLTL